jgi:hypothetical protein
MHSSARSNQGSRVWGLWPVVALLACSATACAASEDGGKALAEVRLTAGWATFGQVLPRGAAKGALRLGDLETQTDVKTRWPDGSVRFAVLTAKVSRAGLYPLRPAAARAGAFEPTVPAASVRFKIGDRAYTAALPPKPSEDRWLAGPLVREWRAVVSPVGDDRKPHPFLRVLFDTRCYSDRKCRVDVTVENVLDQKGATAVTYDVGVTVEGKSALRRDKVAHHYLTRWRKAFAPGLTESAVTPALKPAFEAGAVPRYLSLVSNEVSAIDAKNFEILGKGALEAYMPSHGGRPELAPYPDWTARHLVHKDPRQLRYVLAHGDLAGSWPVHLRESEGGRFKGLGKGRLVSIDQRPNFWLDKRAGRDGLPAGDLGATGPLTPDNAHVPSLAYVPYLLTGDRYYADEMAFWANYALLSTFQDAYYNTRGGKAGLLKSNEVRGIAWALRNLVDAAAYLPSDDPVRAYLAEKVANNLKWADKLAVEHKTPLGTYLEGQAPEQVGTKVWAVPRPWQNNFLAWSLDHAAAQGFSGGERLRDRLARFQYRLFTSKDYPREYACAYTLVIGTRDAEGKVRYFDTLKEVFDATYGKPPAKPLSVAGYYGPDARLMLMIARKKRWPGAEDAYKYLFNWADAKDRSNTLKADLRVRSGWAIAFDDER